MSTIKGRSVQLATFLKWNLENVFDYEVESGLVVKIWCKCCSQYSDHILSDHRIRWLRGKARREMESCIIRGGGSTNVSKYSVTRHLESKAHKIGLEYQQLYDEMTNSTLQPPPPTPPPPPLPPTNKLSVDELIKCSAVQGHTSSASHTCSVPSAQFPVRQPASSGQGTIQSDQVPQHGLEYNYASYDKNDDTSLPADTQTVVKQEPEEVVGTEVRVPHHTENNLGLHHGFLVENEGNRKVTLNSHPYKKRPYEGDAVYSEAEEAYRKLVKTAYLLAVDGQPLSTFKTLVNVQKANGVKLIQGLGRRNDAREFIHELADTIRERLAVILCSTTAFSVLSDCHLACKTGDIKQLILVRTMREGIPVYYTVGLQDIERFGDPGDAETMKKALDEVFQKKVRIPQDCYTKGLVSATSDGHSQNTDVHEELLTNISADGRTWLIPIQCAYHRVKSSLIDILVRETEFVQVKKFMRSVNFLMKSSNNLKDHFRETAKSLGVHVCNFHSVTGSRSRFLHLRRRGVTSLLHNWISLARAIEQSVFNPSQRESRDLSAELRDILKTLQNLDFLLICCLLKSILDILDDLCVKIDGNELFVFEILPNVEEALSRLQDLLDDEDTLLSNAGIVLVHTTISQELPKHGKKKVQPANREHVTVNYEKMITSDESNPFASVNCLKERVLSNLLVCLDKWFSSFQKGIYEHMLWVNPANWRNDPATDLESMQILGRNFATTLEVSGFDESRLKAELKNLKIHVKHYYKGIKAKELWEKIFQYRRTEFINICLLVEVVLAVGVSNSCLDEGLSFLTTMLTDQRFSTNQQAMEDLLIVKANHALWSEKEQAEIIEDALGCYLRRSRRSVTIDECHDLHKLGVSNKRMRLIEESDEESFSDEDSDELSDGELNIPKL